MGRKIRVPKFIIGSAKIGLCLEPALWAEVAAQAPLIYRVVPTLSSIDCGSSRARAVLFRIVHRTANCARPIWDG
jgi:hypothetical protein